MLGRSSPNRQLGSVITLGTSRVNTLGGGPASATSGGTNNESVKTSTSQVNTLGGGPASGGIGPGSNGPHHGIQRIDCNSNPKQCQIETTISSDTNGPGSNCPGSNGPAFGIQRIDCKFKSKAVSD
jgi:hypothetical protein